MMLRAGTAKGQNQPYYIDVSMDAYVDGSHSLINSGYQQISYYDNRTSNSADNIEECTPQPPYVSSSYPDGGISSAQIIGTLGNWSASCNGTAWTGVPYPCDAISDAHASGYVAWRDMITPVSTTLPVGSQVVVRVTEVVNYSAFVSTTDSNVPETQAWVQLSGSANSLEWGDFSYGYPSGGYPPYAVTTFSANTTATVGTPFPLAGQFFIQAAGAAVTNDNEERWDGTIEFSQQVYLDCLTPGVSLISTSGVSYFTHAPTDLTITTAPQGFNLTFSTISNDLYDVQATTDLVSAAWSTIASNIPGNGTTTNYIDTAAAVPQKFYRVYVHF
jgi:hypothetical protein